MKREFLEGLGLNKDVIDTIMSEYGKSISSLKEKATSAEALGQELDSLKEEKGNIEKTLAKVSEEYSTFKHGVISELIEEARPSSALAKKELERILSENEKGDLKKALRELKSEYPDAFSSDGHDLPVFSAVSSYSEVSVNGLNFSRVR